MAQYDFHYLPLEGKITGKQVLQQTQDAINDLGNRIVDIETDTEAITEAVEIAQDAKNTADNAETIANDAMDVAQAERESAQEAAQEANQAATNAANSASSASTTATQLMEYLATKEEITAPAVDPTLTISGAAADAKATGDAFRNLTLPINLGFELGWIANDGTESESSDGRLVRTSAYLETAKVYSFKTNSYIGTNPGATIFYYDANYNLATTRIELPQNTTITINKQYPYYRVRCVDYSGHALDTANSWFTVTELNQIGKNKIRIEEKIGTVLKTDKNVGTLKFCVAEKGVSSLKIYGRTIQPGTGLPSPSNVRALSGIGTYNSETDKYDVTLSITDNVGTQTITASINSPLYDGDYIDFANGTVYRGAYKDVITSTRTITQESVSVHKRFRIAGGSADWNTDKGRGYSNSMYPSITPLALGVPAYYHDNSITGYNGSSLVYVVAETYTTVDAFKAYLADNPIEYIGYRNVPTTEQATLSTTLRDVEGNVTVTCSGNVIEAIYQKDAGQEIIDSKNGVTVGVGGDYADILTALKCTDDSVKLRVLAGEHDIIQAYENWYGSNYFDNYNSNNGNFINNFDIYMYGLASQNNREIVFDAGATLKCEYAGNNTDVQNHFSAFAPRSGSTLKNMYLKYNNIRYAVHDDFGGDKGDTIYDNCIFDGTPNYSGVIGGGCGTNNNYIVRDCIFLVGGDVNKNCVSYHNNKGATGKSKILVTGCKGNGSCAFYWYGTSTEITDCIVSNCDFKYINLSAHSSTPHDVENMRLTQFNNTVQQ